MFVGLVVRCDVVVVEDPNLEDAVVSTATEVGDGEHGHQLGIRKRDSKGGGGGVTSMAQQFLSAGRCHCNA